MQSCSGAESLNSEWIRERAVESRFVVLNEREEFVRSFRRDGFEAALGVSKARAKHGLDHHVMNARDDFALEAAFRQLPVSATEIQLPDRSDRGIGVRSKPERKLS